MKKAYSILISAILSFNALAVAQDTEIQAYKVIKAIDSVEIRFYPSATLVQTSGGNNFGKLFRYISGSNKSDEKIAMTAPVYMNEDKSKMAFVMPLDVHQKGAPEPIGENVSLRITEPRYVAAIRYGGYTNSNKEATYTKRLMEALKENSIKTNGTVEFLGYDSPYKFYNRRNEVMVEIAYNK
ncbi:MAG: SOUL heme-binding protein [Flavobacteriaceae bacterium]|nr:SOUL heme-binding protein [Flavobacteriaceae bacterium]|tara:strand:- start:1566 stop:2114 length:549 start_codon:yes stop_codon:yes gene_type:complete